MESPCVLSLKYHVSNHPILCQVLCAYVLCRSCYCSVRVNLIAQMVFASLNWSCCLFWVLWDCGGNDCARWLMALWLWSCWRAHWGSICRPHSFSQVCALWVLHRTPDTHTHTHNCADHSSPLPIQWPVIAGDRQQKTFPRTEGRTLTVSFLLGSLRDHESIGMWASQNTAPDSPAKTKESNSSASQEPSLYRLTHCLWNHIYC